MRPQGLPCPPNSNTGSVRPVTLSLPTRPAELRVVLLPRIADPRARGPSPKRVPGSWQAVDALREGMGCSHREVDEVPGLGCSEFIPEVFTVPFASWVQSFHTPLPVASCPQGKNPAVWHPQDSISLDTRPMLGSPRCLSCLASACMPPAMGSSPPGWCSWENVLPVLGSSSDVRGAQLDGNLARGSCLGVRGGCSLAGGHG